VTTPHVVHVFQPEVGGVPAYAVRLGVALLDRGWHVTVAAPPAANHLEAVREAGGETVELDMTRAVRPSREYHAVRRLRELHRRHPVALFHAHSSKAGPIAGTAARISRVPVVYTPHFWSFGMPGPAPMRAAYAAIEALFARHVYRRVITVSTAERTEAIRWRVARPDAVSVVHTGWNRPEGADRADARRELGLREDDFVAAWVGRNDEQKRPHDLAPLAERLGPEVRLAALGTGLAGSAAGAALEASGGIVLPAGTRPDLLYAAADVLVLTSAWEAFPLSVLEAIHFGLPVVAYAVGDVPEQVIAGTTGVLVEPRDVDGMAAAVLALARDPDRCRAMAAQAQNLARERFTFDAMVGRIEEIYGEVAGIRRPPSCARNLADGPNSAPTLAALHSERSRAD
jgi:glycosyltransferase involved in cell wall biosynthesis